MNLKVPFIVGYVSLKSSLSLEAVGEILSTKLFGGLNFEGKDLEINDEVPAIFIQSRVLGLKVILNGYSGFKQGQTFNLSITPWTDIPYVQFENVRLDSYLFHLLKIELKDIPEIEVLEG